MPSASYFPRGQTDEELKHLLGVAERLAGMIWMSASRLALTCRRCWFKKSARWTGAIWTPPAAGLCGVKGR
jgi:hypothetical protein